MMDVFTYSCCDYSKTMLVKGGPAVQYADGRGYKTVAEMNQVNIDRSFRMYYSKETK